MNKIFSKPAGLVFYLGIIDVLFILYFFLRCGQTQSTFYCGAFEFGAIFWLFGIPVLVLLVLAFLTWFFSRGRTVLLVLALIVFLAPYASYFSSSRPKTYHAYQEYVEQKNLEQKQKQEQECTEIKQWLLLHQSDQPPMPMRVLPLHCI